MKERKPHIRSWCAVGWVCYTRFEQWETAVPCSGYGMTIKKAYDNWNLARTQNWVSFGRAHMSDATLVRGS